VNGLRTDGRGWRDRGSALLIVLWSALVIAGLAAVVAGTVRTDLTVVRHQVAEAQARYLAQAGVLHGVLLMLADGDPVLLTNTIVGFDATDIRLHFADECGKVDLNTGWGDLLRRLVDGHAGDTAVAAAILDWRDPDSASGPGGAEDAQYRAAGRTHGARNGPFESVAELQQVLGVDVRLMRALRSDVTVDCLNAGVDPLTASDTVLAAIPGLGADARRAFLAARQSYVAAGLRGSAPQLAGGGRYVTGSHGLAVEIRADAPSPGGGAVSWRAVIWLTGDGGLPFLFRAWERGGF